MSRTDALVAFTKARLDEAERTIYREGTPPHGVIAWLTYNQPDGSMGYTTVASGDSESGVWIADGKVLPEPASVLVVYDPKRALRDIAAKRAVVARYEASVRSVGEGLSRDRRNLVLAFAAVWEDHPDYRAEWAPV